MQFRTKARAVDLLGKGQIADLPTAITELWKNGYDAYADNLFAELYMAGYKGLNNHLFVISDDGVGMTRSDIFDKWLVLGIDSKSRTRIIDSEGEDTLWKEPRVKAGEKGIGRLSVAYLGSPMLMLTKKKGYPLQAMFFDWRVLENYNMFLDDVDIPVMSVSNNGFSQVFGILKTSFLKNIETSFDKNGRAIWESEQEELRTLIKKETESLYLPPFFEDEIVNTMLDINYHGTKFIVFNPESQIVNLVDSTKDDLDDSSFVRTSLVGFTNQFKPQQDRLPIKCSFPIFKDDSAVSYDYLVGQGNFFNEKDFDYADIVIDGFLDGTGVFEGRLTIYGKNVDYSFTNPRKKDTSTFYGKVPMRIGYSMGRADDSLYNEDIWGRLNSKVKSYGGIYIYRDGFRVLPYGRVDADFLKLEEKRSKRIGSSFFSYRRMFGYIELTRAQNGQLKDKSSREGLINNAAFRAFKDDLAAVFEDLAAEYFSDKAKQTIFLEEKRKANAQSEVIKKDKEREQQEKRAFSNDLKGYPTRFNQYKTEYYQTINALKDKLALESMVFSDIETLLNNLQQLDAKYSELLPKRPKRYKLTERQEEKLDEYTRQLEEFRNDSLLIKDDAIKAARSRLQIQDIRKDFANLCNTYISAIEEATYKTLERFQIKTNQLKRDIEEKSSVILMNLKAQKDNSLNSLYTNADVERETYVFQTLFNSLHSYFIESFEPLVSHIEKLNLDIDEELLQGAYKEQYEKIKEQWQISQETSQLGIAVEIIDHEFNALYSRINSLLSRVSEQIHTREFTDLRRSFEALEDKYALLSPLYRISGSISKEIKCSDLKQFLLHFFENRILSNNTQLISTEEFDRHIIYIREPVIHSVLINIVNNALFWMKSSTSKIIELAYDSQIDGIIIRNSGIPISDNKLDRIFELFYSNRPNGRGLGLYLAKQSLNDCYYDIFATNDKKYNTLQGACFIIKPLGK